MRLIKRILLFILSVAFLHSNSLYAKTPQYPTGNLMPSKNEKLSLFHYMNNVLIEAGIPEEPRKYLIDLSRQKLSDVDEVDFPVKKELLRKNLYILLIDLAAKKPLLLEENQTDFSSGNLDFFSTEHMNYLRSNQVFDELNVGDVKHTFVSICPLWPFC
jgi:hypothetical protein